MKNNGFIMDEITDVIENIDMSDFWKDEEEELTYEEPEKEPDYWEDTYSDDDFDSLFDIAEDVFDRSDIITAGISDKNLMTKIDLWNDLVADINDSDLLISVLAATVTAKCGTPFSVNHIIDSVYFDGKNGFGYYDVCDAVLAADEFFNIWCHSHLADFDMRCDSLKTISYIFQNMPEYQC